MNVELSAENLQNLEVFAPLLRKESNEMINEALELYFQEAIEKLEAQKNSETNLSYEEFWDDIDI
ncbi:MAG: hypothetical protein JXQ67_06400 [Campylobacterales bacterium]|nr:hypothetical protein [Campylobacterales bacterium]